MNLDNKLFLQFCIDSIPGGKAAWGTKLTEEKKAYARQAWHQWVAIRQILGTCIRCNRKHRPDEQRCGVHRNINKAKCLAWARANRDAIRAEYKSRVNAGVCVNNPKHGVSFNRHTQCVMCYTNRKNRKSA